MKQLSDQIQKFKESFVGQVPEDIRNIMAQATENLAESGITERSLQTGGSIPSVSLPDQNNEVVSLGTLKGQPFILTFYRGGWCPYCNLQLKVYQDHLAEIKNLGAELIAITPELPDASVETVKNDGVTFSVLSDKENVVAKQFGLVFSLAEELRPIYNQFGIDIPKHNGDETYELPLAATYLVDKDGKIVWDFVTADYTKRADIEDLLEALKGLS